MKVWNFKTWYTFWCIVWAFFSRHILRPNTWTCLYMQDKKNRYYIVSALADAKVDLKGIYYCIYFLNLKRLNAYRHVDIAETFCNICTVNWIVFTHLFLIYSWILMEWLVTSKLSSSISKAWFGESRFENGSWRSIGKSTSGWYMHISSVCASLPLVCAYSKTMCFFFFDK